MATKIQDLRWVKAIDCTKRATGTVSAVVDMGYGGNNFDDVLVVCNKSAFSSKGSKMVIRARHTTASGTLYASSTAFNTALAASGATGSAAELVGLLIHRSGGTGRFLRLLLSSATASSQAGVDVLLTGSDRILPPTTGFASITYSPPAP